MTVKEHDLVPGGNISFFMTGPDGEESGMWEVLAVDPPTRLELKDAIVDDNGTPVDEGPAQRGRHVHRARADGGTTMATELAFPSLEAVEQATQQMGMADGMKITFAQIEAVLADA